MATYLPGSGQLSINDINTLFGRGNNLNAYRGTTYYTSSSGPFTFSSGAISISNFYGTGPSANTFSFSIASNQTNANLRSLAVSAGWDQSSAVIATVNSGVYIYSTSTGTAGLTINGSWPGGVTLVNDGFIMGMGGRGGNATSGQQSGLAGGSAISLGVNCTITNNSYIGGGGGGGSREASSTLPSGAGGGAGGGQGGSNGNGDAGGAGGGPGSSGSNGVRSQKAFGKNLFWIGSGGGGGRIMPGTGGAAGTSPNEWGLGGGAGGGGGHTQSQNFSGAGGSGGASGGNFFNVWGAAGGGGWGASGGGAAAGGSPGGAGGYAIALNGFTATRNGSGTTYGTVA